MPGHDSSTRSARAVRFIWLCIFLKCLSRFMCPFLWSSWEEDGESTRYYKVDPSANVVVFKRMPPAGTWLFRVSESIARVFCTQDFKDAYDAHCLKGVIFKPMALSESYVPPPPPPPRRLEEERA